MIDKIKIDTETNYLIYFSGSVKKLKCDYCKQEFDFKDSYIPFKIGDLQFCSWTCKCRYKKNHYVDSSDNNFVFDLYEEYCKKRKINYFLTKRKIKILNIISQIMKKDINKKYSFEELYSMNSSEKLKNILEVISENDRKKCEE